MTRLASSFARPSAHLSARPVACDTRYSPAHDFSLVIALNKETRVFQDNLIEVLYRMYEAIISVLDDRPDAV